MSSRVLPANVRCEGTTSSAGAGTSTEHTDTAGSTLKATRGPTPLQPHAAPAPVLPAKAMDCLSSPHRLQDAEARLEQAAATRGTSRVRYNTLGDDTTDMNNIVVGEMNDARTPRAALLHGPRHGGRRGGRDDTHPGRTLTPQQSPLSLVNPHLSSGTGQPAERRQGS